MRNGEWVSQESLARKTEIFPSTSPIFFSFFPFPLYFYDYPRYEIILSNNSSILPPSINWIIPETNNILSLSLSPPSRKQEHLSQFTFRFLDFGLINCAPSSYLPRNPLLPVDLEPTTPSTGINTGNTSLCRRRPRFGDPPFNFDPCPGDEAGSL